METYRNLYPRIHTFAHLYWAFRDAQRGKRDRAAVASFEVRPGAQPVAV